MEEIGERVSDRGDGVTLAKIDAENRSNQSDDLYVEQEITGSAFLQPRYSTARHPRAT